MTLDVPPPPPGEPAGDSTPTAERLTPIVLPAGAPTRSPVLLLAVGIAAVVGVIVNTIGLVGFPYNAPVEQIYALGINVDLIAIAVVSGIGAFVSRRGYPLRATTPIATIAVAFAAASAVVWVLAGGIGSVVGLAIGSGRYMYASAGLFYGGALWVLAVIFAAHGYRRGGARTNNVLAIVALGVAGVLALFAIASSVLYGLDLTN
jgi:hypothetical protein